MSLLENKRHIQNDVIVWERPSFNSCIALWPFLILHVFFVSALFFSLRSLGEHRTKPTEVEETFELGKVPHHRRYAKWPFDAQHMLLGQNYDFGPKCETSSFFWGGPIGRWVCVCVCAGLGQDQWWSYTNLESESYWMKISYNGNKQWGISKLWWYTMVNGSYNLRRTQTVESLI